MIFHPALETMPREELENLQLRRLQDLCTRLYGIVPFYRKRFDEIGMTPGDVKSLNDLKKLPFTEKQDLRDNYPFGLFAVPKDIIVRIHASSGTTGIATVAGYTRRDIATWADCVARCFAMAGLTQRDIIHVAYGYGLFTGGLGAHYGSEKLGAITIPVSGGSTRRQVQLMRDFGATTLCCTPSYALYLWEEGHADGIDLAKLPLRVGVFGAEPWTDEMRKDIESKLGIEAFDIYGLSEIMGPGVAMECQEGRDGMHLQEDIFLPEIINSATGEQLPAGEVGELVLTTLTKEGLPLLRYRTHDITSLNYNPCLCGRTFARASRMTGRSDDMLIIRGVNVYPTQIESILLEAEDLAPHYQITVDREGNLDTMEIKVEVKGSVPFGTNCNSLCEVALQKDIKAFLGVSAKVRLVEPGSIPRSEGKASRVTDKRAK